MEPLLRDLKFSIRMLAKSPGFTLVAVIALALGIGANSAIFSVVNAVLLKPLPYKDPERLAMIWGRFDGHGLPRNWISEPEFFEIKERNQSFEEMAVYTTGGMNLTGEGEPVRVMSAFVSGSLFSVLGVTAAQGRTLLPEDDQPGATKVALIGHSLWRSRFASDPGLVNREISLNGQKHTVVGVLPQGFQYPADTELWVPLGLDRAKLNSRGSHYLELIAHRSPGVSIAQAGSDLASIASQLQQENPNNYGADSGWGLFLVPLHQQLVGDVRAALLVLLGAVGFVLLITCANVANLLLARATVREKEIAIRAALGARRGRLVSQLLTESVLLAALGGVLGLVLALVSVKLFVAVGPRDIPRLDEVGIDLPVLGFSLLVSLITGILFGLAPAFHISKPDLHEALKEGGRSSGAGSGRRRLRSLLVVSEVALALVLLVGAGLMIKSFQRVLEVNLGFRSENVLTLRLSLPTSKYKGDAEVAAFYRQLLDRLRALPGVQSAGAVSQLPLSGAYSSGTTVVEDTSAGDESAQRLHGHPFIEADRRTATPDYFRSLDIALVKGRVLAEADTADAPPVVVIDEAFARRFWPAGDPIGKRVAVAGTPDNIRWGQIVGVVSHVRHYGYSKEGREQIYFPYLQRPARTMYLTIRTATDPLSLTSAVRDQVLAVDRDQPIYEVKSMEQLRSVSVAQPRLNVTLFAVFAAVAMILASAGVYGVMAYSVTQRTHEIGIRMALGARSGDVVRMVVRQGLLITTSGVAIGLGAAVALTRLMQGLLFQISPTDPVTFGTIAVSLTGVALVACLIPARRAARVDPMVALRYE